MSVTLTKRTTYQAMCDRCRSISRWWDTPGRAAEDLARHFCQPL